MKSRQEEVLAALTSSNLLTRAALTIAMSLTAIACSSTNSGTAPPDGGDSQKPAPPPPTVPGRGSLEEALPAGMTHSGAEWRWEKDSARMVPVPGATVLSVERRLRRVPKIKEAGDFWIDSHEVTVAMFRRFCAESGTPFPEQPAGLSDSCPVVNVTWAEAAAYSAWAGKRLPTSWEWFAAALGDREFPWGSGEPGSVAIHFPEWPEVDGWSPVPVGSDSTDLSPFGCQDMGGNVQEWVSDDRKRGPSDSVNQDAPREWRAAYGWRLRTVGVSGTPPYERGAWRDADQRVRSVGFRCAVSR